MKNYSKCGNKSIIGRIVPLPLQDLHVLILTTFEYVLLHGKGDLSVELSLLILTLKWRDYPELCGCARCNHKGPHKREGDVKMEAGLLRMLHCWLCFSERERVQVSKGQRERNGA